VGPGPFFVCDRDATAAAATFRSGFGRLPSASTSHGQGKRWGWSEGFAGNELQGYPAFPGAIVAVPLTHEESFRGGIAVGISNNLIEASMKNLVRSMANIVAISALATGCGDSAPPGNGDATTVQACLPIDDCGIGQRCVNAVCQRMWLAAFESGYGAKEELWLLPEVGDPVRVIGPEGGPAPSDLVPRSTAGYEDVRGRIGNVVFDAETQRLFVGLEARSGYEARALDLSSGTWSTLGTSVSRPLIVQAELGLIIVLPGADSTKILSQVNGVFEVALAGPVSPYSIYESDIIRYNLGAGERIYIPGVIHVERTATGYVPVELPPGVPQDLDWFRASPSGTHACAKGNDGTAWLLDGTRAIQLDLPSPLGGCLFASRGGRLLFNSGYAGQSTGWVFDLQGNVLASFNNLDLQIDQSAIGYGSVGHSVVEVDWSSLSLHTLLNPGADAGYQAGAARLWLMGESLLVEQDMGCMDCHASSLDMLTIAGGTITPVLDFHGWDFMQVAILADGTALIARASALGSTHTLSPDRLLRVDALGGVTDVGPFPGLVSDLHAPIALSIR
jgi:hypothetical protein